MNRIFLTAPLALAASVLFISASINPAAADEAFCTTMPQQIKDYAAKTPDQSAVRKAMKYSHTGVLLCEAGNERAAKKKFETAFKTLGTPEAEYAELAD
jgi:hypothetical protein